MVSDPMFYVFIFIQKFYMLRANKYARRYFKSPQMFLKVGVADLYSTVQGG